MVLRRVLVETYTESESGTLLRFFIENTHLSQNFIDFHDFSISYLLDFCCYVVNVDDSLFFLSFLNVAKFSMGALWQHSKLIAAQNTKTPPTIHHPPLTYMTHLKV